MKKGTKRALSLLLVLMTALSFASAAEGDTLDVMIMSSDRNMVEGTRVEIIATAASRARFWTRRR